MYNPSMSVHKVMQAHKPSDPDGLTGSAGEWLTFERRPTKYQGWLWCHNNNGAQSWVPEAWLKIEGEQAILLRDYSARELSVVIGELVTVELSQSEWAYCRKKNGKLGWLPLTCLQEVGE